MEVFMILMALFYFSTGFIKNIMEILDRLDARTEKHNEEVRKRIKLG